jgi:hypothetical protein
MLVVFLGVLKQALLLGAALVSTDDWVLANPRAGVLLLDSMI